MALEPRYERQVQARAAAGAPLASAESFGAGFARSVENLGNTVHRGDVEAYQRERAATRDRETTDFMRNFAAYRENMDGVSREGRKNALPGASGHVEGMAKAVDAGRSALLDGITEDSVREMATRQMDDYAARFRSNEADWAEVTRAGKVLTDFTEATDIEANRIRRLEDPGSYADAVNLYYQHIDTLNLPDDAKARLKRETVDQKFAIAFLRGRIEEDPVLAKAMMDKGVFDGALEPAQMEALLNGADVEIRSREVAARAEAAAAKAAVVERIQTLEELNRQGVTISDADLAVATNEAAALGDTSLAVRLDGVRAANGFARTWGNANATPQQREAQMLALASLEKRTAEQDRELKWLQDNSGGMNSAFDRDPTAAIGTRSGLPPVDWSDPASIAGRAAWARSQTAANGRLVPAFTNNEIVPLQEMRKVAGGEAQVYAVLDTISDPVLQLAAARQIAPDDTGFQQRALIRPQFRERVQRGTEALKANTALLKPTVGSSGEAQLANLGNSLDRVLVAASPADREAIKQTARAYLAGLLDQYGQTGDAITEEMAANAALVAMGGEYRRGPNGERVKYGGIASWGSKAFAVEDGFTAREIARAFTADLARQKAAKKGPVNRDGSAFDLGRAYPVWIGGGRYRWETSPGVHVRREDNTPYISEVGVRQ